MLSFFRTLSQRLKALFVADVGLDFEAEWLSRAAERKASLLRQADRYEREGLKDVAGQLRGQAESLSLERPLAGVLPAIEHWQEVPIDEASQLLLPIDTPAPTSGVTKRQSHSRKKGK